MVTPSNIGNVVNRGFFTDAVVISGVSSGIPRTPLAAVPASETIHSATKYSNPDTVEMDSISYTIAEIVSTSMMGNATRAYKQNAGSKKLEKNDRQRLQRINFIRKIERQHCEHCIDNICSEIEFRCGDRYQVKVDEPESFSDKKVPRACKYELCLKNSNYNLYSQNIAVLVDGKKLNNCLDVLEKKGYGKKINVLTSSENAIRVYDKSKADKSIRFSVFVCDAEKSEDVLNYFYLRNFVPDKIIIIKSKTDAIPHIVTYFKNVCEVIDYENM